LLNRFLFFVVKGLHVFPKLCLERDRDTVSEIKFQDMLTWGC